MHGRSPRYLVRPRISWVVLFCGLLLVRCSDDKKAVNEPCDNSTDCADQICHNGVCGSSDPRGQGSPCSGAGDCKSFHCVNNLCLAGIAKAGTACRHGEECASKQCVNNVCSSGADAGTDAEAPVHDQQPVQDLLIPDLQPDSTPKPLPGWVRVEGATGDEAGAAVLPDGSGGCYVTGHVTQQTTFGGYPLGITATSKTDAFVAHYDQLGKVTWAKASQGTMTATVVRGRAMALGAAHLHVAGELGDNATFGTHKTSCPFSKQACFFVTRVELKSPSFTWATFGFIGNKEQMVVNGIGVDGYGNSYITGQCKGTSKVSISPVIKHCWGSCPNGTGDIFVARLNSSGGCDWVKFWGGSGEDAGTGIVVTPTGKVYIAGYFSSSVKFDSITKTAKGKDLFVAELDPSKKSWSWVQTAGGPNDDMARGLARDPQGKLYVTGSFSGSADFGTTKLSGGATRDVFVASLDPTGASFAWAAGSDGKSMDNEGQAIAVDAKGNNYLTGRFSAPLAFGTLQQKAGVNDLFVTKVSSGGTFSWIRAAGGSGADSGHGVAVDAAGQVYTTGRVTGAVAFDGKPVKASTNDAFVWKIDATKLP